MKPNRRRSAGVHHMDGITVLDSLGMGVKKDALPKILECKADIVGICSQVSVKDIALYARQLPPGFDSRCYVINESLRICPIAASRVVMSLYAKCVGCLQHGHERRIVFRC